MKKYGVAFLFIFFIAGCKPGRSREDSTTRYYVQDTTKWPSSFGFGKKATEEEIERLSISILPDGKGLPAGNGNATTGKIIYQVKCAACHGGESDSAAGDISEAPYLISKKNLGKPFTKVKTIANYWPYATTLFDYIRRSMPYNAPGSLSNEDVYNLTAYLLSANKLIDSTFIIDSTTLPKINMPAQKLFIPDGRRGGPEIK